MTSPATHFEIYAEEPAKLVSFCQSLFGWEIEQVPGIAYWRIQTGAGGGAGIGGGLLYRRGCRATPRTSPSAGTSR